MPARVMERLASKALNILGPGAMLSATVDETVLEGSSNTACAIHCSLPSAAAPTNSADPDRAAGSWSAALTTGFVASKGDDMSDPGRNGHCRGWPDYRQGIRTEPRLARSPLQLMVDAARLAARDAGARMLLPEIESITAIRSFNDTVPGFPIAVRQARERTPWSLPARYRGQPREFLYPPSGGDIPQRMVTRSLTRLCRRHLVGSHRGRRPSCGRKRNAKARRARAGLECETRPFEPDESAGRSLMYSQAEIDRGMRSPASCTPCSTGLARSQGG